MDWMEQEINSPHNVYFYTTKIIKIQWPDQKNSFYLIASHFIVKVVSKSLFSHCALYLLCVMPNPSLPKQMMRFRNEIQNPGR
jgi:hypothetical protein